MVSVKEIDGVMHTRESIIHQYNDLVYKHANNLCRSNHHNMEDLAQEGFIGLLEAFERYDPDNGNKFITYAYQYVRGYMIRLHDKWHPVHVPHSVIRLAWKINREKMWDKSDQEIADFEGETVRSVIGARIFFASRHFTSIDKALHGNEEDETLHNYLFYEQDFTTGFVSHLKEKLSPRERVVAHKLYQGYMQSEIAQEFGISRARVNSMVRKIRLKMHKEIS